MGAAAPDRRRGLLRAAATSVVLVAGGCGDGSEDLDAGPLVEASGTDVATVVWQLPRASAAKRPNAEDTVYRLLDDGQPRSCAAALDEAGERDAPFDSGPRGADTYRAAAQLCLGDRAGAMATFAAARRRPWDGPVDRVTWKRTCTVWDRVARLLTERPPPCTLDVTGL